MNHSQESDTKPNSLGLDRKVHRMSIWIVKRHPPMPYRDDPGHLDAFTIHSTHATKSDAQKVVDKKMQSKTTNYLYTVGRVDLTGGSDSVAQA